MARAYDLTELIWSWFIFLAVLHCLQTNAGQPSCGKRLCETKECIDISYSILNKINQSADPCDDFYKFACGNWMSANEHKMDEMYYNINSDEIATDVDDLLKDLIFGKRKFQNEQFYATKPFLDLSYFHQSCLETGTIQELGTTPAQKTLRNLKEFFIEKPFDASSWNLSKAVVELMKMNGNVLFSLTMNVDIYNTSRWMPTAMYNNHEGILQEKTIRHLNLKRVFDSANGRETLKKFKMKLNKTELINLNIKRIKSKLQTIIPDVKTTRVLMRKIRTSKILQKSNIHGLPNEKTSFFQRLIKSIPKIPNDNQDPSNKNSINSQNQEKSLNRNQNIPQRQQNHDINPNQNQDLFQNQIRIQNILGIINSNPLNTKTTEPVDSKSSNTLNSSYVGANSNAETNPSSEANSTSEVMLNLDGFTNFNETFNNDEDFHMMLEELLNMTSTLGNYTNEIDQQEVTEELLGILDIKPEMNAIDFFKIIMEGTKSSFLSHAKNILKNEEYANLFHLKFAYDQSTTEDKQRESQIMNITEGEARKSIENFLERFYETELDEREKMLLKATATSYDTPTVRELQKRYPFIEWQYVLNELIEGPIGTEDRVLILYDQYFERLNKLVLQHEPWVVHYSILTLFISDVLHELVETESTTEGRESYCLEVTKKLMQVPLTHMYLQYSGKDVIHNLQKELKPLTRYLKKATIEVMAESRFLTETDKKSAAKKTEAIEWLIGGYKSYYDPKYIEDYMSGLQIKPEDFYGNVMQLYDHRWRRSYKLYNEKVHSSKHVWEFGAPSYVVNAFNSQNTNSIVLPLAFFNAPYFYPGAPDFIRFGNTGTAIAHEIMHAFDATGVLFDERGNYHRKFSKKMSTQMKKNLECYNKMLEEEFSTVHEIEGVLLKFDVDTTASTAENIADVMGFNIAFRAYQDYVKNERMETDNLPGFSYSKEQLFFIAFAQPYCGIIRDEAKVLLMNLDEHMLNYIRVNGIVKNSPEFEKAFQCRSKQVSHQRRHHEPCLIV